MPKVLYIIDTLETGGAETSILEIASRLKSWKPIVICIYSGESLKSRFEDAGIKVYSLNLKGKYEILQGKKQIIKIVKRENPDLIHATLFRAEQFSRWIGPKLRIPVLNSFVNDSYSPERYSLLSTKQKFVLDWYKLLDRFTARRVNQFMSITKAIIPNNSEALKIDSNKVQVIYRGRDFEKLKNKIDFQKIQSYKKLYSGGPVILTVSRLLQRKGYLEAIQAMKKVLDYKPDVQYLVAGEGYDRGKFEELIQEYNLEKNIFLLGNRDDVPSLLHFCDIFLFPSHYEGQGGALVEAMLMGKPIIASNIDVIAESVEHNSSALLFKTKDVPDLTEKILWALDHPVEMANFGAKAKIEAEKRFNIESIAENHEKLYDTMVSKYNVC